MTDMNMNTAQQPSSEKKSISCVTCNAPLPIGDDGKVEEPDYFVCSSSGWSADNEGERDMEDLDALCRHLMTVGSAIRDVFALMHLGAREDLKPFNLGVLDDRQAQLEDLRSRCHLLRDLEGEAGRKVQRFDAWVSKEIRAAEGTEV